jgi:hypothetical protein
MFTACPTGQYVATRRPMRARLLRLVVVGAVAFTLLAPAAAHAVTVDQVVALAQAGVTDAVILALIDRDRTIFGIEPEQIVKLQRDGLSEAVILAMLKSGREEGEQAARTDAAANTAWIAAGLAPAPELVIVGHGPDRPNTGHYDSFNWSSPAYGNWTSPAYGGIPVPYGIPSFSRSFGASRRHSNTPLSGGRRFDATQPRALCYAQVRSAGSGVPLSMVTECPAVMQPRRLR